MGIVLFIVILAVLIIVHEYGHFIVAKKGGVRVDEFGLGYPPRAAKLFTRKGTDFTLNWLPFGGFVKIFGENPDDESLSGEDKNRAFVNKSRILQAGVLFAGPFMNFLFAWLVILTTLFVGLPTAIDEKMSPEDISNKSTLITDIVSNSPANIAGLLPGDTVLEVDLGDKKFPNINTENLHKLVLDNPNANFSIIYKRGEDTNTVILKPKTESSGEILLGVGLTEYGIYKPSFWRAIPDSFKFTGVMIANITLALVHLVTGIFSGGADVSNLTGPIGIVGLVGNASREGLVYLLSFTALISINLGIINLIPFPALDGGRLLFLLIEKIKGGKVNYKIFNIFNMVGFSLLIILMLVVSYHDILKIL